MITITENFYPFILFWKLVCHVRTFEFQVALLIIMLPASDAENGLVLNENSRRLICRHVNDKMMPKNVDEVCFHKIWLKFEKKAFWNTKLMQAEMQGLIKRLFTCVADQLSWKKGTEKLISLSRIACRSIASSIFIIWQRSSTWVIKFCKKCFHVRLIVIYMTQMSFIDFAIKRVLINK